MKKFEFEYHLARPLTQGDIEKLLFDTNQIHIHERVDTLPTQERRPSNWDSRHWHQLNLK